MSATLDLVDFRPGPYGIEFEFQASSPRAFPADGADLREAIRRDSFFRKLDAELRRARQAPDLVGSVPGNSYVVGTGAAAIALSAATAKTLMYLLVGVNNQPALIEFCVGFDGVTSSAVPALVELCYGTAATNSTPGTGSTAFTPLQERGWPAQASAASAANNCTSEPTVLTALKPYLLSPNGGLIVIQSPLGREHTGIVTAATSGKMIALRANAPAAVNSRGYLEYEE